MYSMWTYPIMFLSIRSETGSRTDAWSWNGPFRTVWLTPARPMWPRIWCITRICTVSVPLRIPGTIPRSRRPQHLTAWAFTTVLCLWRPCISTAPYRAVLSIPATLPWWAHTSPITPSTTTPSERRPATKPSFLPVYICAFVNTGWSAISNVIFFDELI